MPAVTQVWAPCPLDDCPVLVVVPVRLGTLDVWVDDDDRPQADVEATPDLRPLAEHLRVNHRIVPRPADG